MHVWNNLASFDSHGRLDHTSQPCGTFQMAEVRLDRSNIEWLVSSWSKDAADCTGLNGVTNCCTCTMRLEIISIGKVKTSLSICLSDQVSLSSGTGYCQTSF